MQRLYKINPTCPGCGEEHLYWQVGLTDEEQAIFRHTHGRTQRRIIHRLFDVPSRSYNHAKIKVWAVRNRI